MSLKASTKSSMARRFCKGYGIFYKVFQNERRFKNASHTKFFQNERRGCPKSTKFFQNERRVLSKLVLPSKLSTDNMKLSTI